MQFDFLSVLVVFVFKLLLSFWLCEEAQCVYLHLHLARKPDLALFTPVLLDSVYLIHTGNCKR